MLSIERPPIRIGGESRLSAEVWVRLVGNAAKKLNICSYPITYLILQRGKQRFRSSRTEAWGVQTSLSVYGGFQHSRTSIKCQIIGDISRWVSMLAITLKISKTQDASARYAHQHHLSINLDPRAILQIVEHQEASCNDTLTTMTDPLITSSNQ